MLLIGRRICVATCDLRAASYADGPLRKLRSMGEFVYAVVTSERQIFFFSIIT